MQSLESHTIKTNIPCFLPPFCRDYLIDEHQDKKGSAYDITGWTFSCPKDIPQQMNGSDCGMFACKFADYVSRDKRITFTQVKVLLTLVLSVCGIWSGL